MVTLSTTTEAKTQPSQPIGNATAKAGIELKGDQPADDGTSNGDLVVQHGWHRTQHRRPHDLDQVIHEIERYDPVAAAELTGQPEYRSDEHQDLNQVADQRRNVAKTGADDPQ